MDALRYAISSFCINNDLNTIKNTIFGQHIHIVVLRLSLLVELEFGNIDCWGEGKTGVALEKPLVTKERTNNKLNPHKLSMPGFESGPFVGGLYSHHCAPPLLPHKSQKPRSSQELVPGTGLCLFFSRYFRVLFTCKFGSLTSCVRFGEARNVRFSVTFGISWIKRLKRRAVHEIDLIHSRATAFGGCA